MGTGLVGDIVSRYRSGGADGERGMMVVHGGDGGGRGVMIVVEGGGGEEAQDEREW